MLFHTTEFIALVGALALVYPMLARRVHLRNAVLLATSYVFYGWWDARFLSLLVLSTGVDFAVARTIQSSDRPAVRRVMLGVSILVNLGVLATFKYLNFFIESAAALLGVSTGDVGALRSLQIVLPVGISFYTFQTLGYTVDVYRRTIPACRDPLRFALYVAFFPQLVAGPIERASRLLPQLARPMSVAASDRAIAVYWIVLGYFKKIYVADNLAGSVDPVFADPTSHATLVRYAAIVGFAFQIYADFSGYTDIARGVARGMGFRLSVNFRTPYFAIDPRDFWRRWHITLSTWLRDYVYIPMGGNRGGKSSVSMRLMITMVLGGLWHGAAWTFVVWGIYHGGLLCVTHLYRASGGERSVSHRGLRIAGMFTLTLIGWAIFRSPDVATATAMLSPNIAAMLSPNITAMLSPNIAAMVSPGVMGAGPAGWADGVVGVRPLMVWLLKLSLYAGPLVAMDWVSWRTGDSMWLLKRSAVTQTIAMTIAVLAIVTLGYFGETSFIYFQF